MRRWLRLTIALLVAVTGTLGPFLGTSTGFAQGPADSRFGLDFVNQPDAVAGSSRLDQATSLGVGWDRFPMYWSSMQSGPGVPIDFSGSDPLVASDLARGFAIDAILVGAPAWATTSDGVDLNAWSSFVSQTVSHYQGKVHDWEMWNEPDMLNGQGQGLYWPWSVSAYYQLLKTGYQAVKSADPNSTVILGGIAFPYNNQDFFPKFLAEMAKDPTAAANHGYFDVLAFHSYDRVDRTYELPLGYFGTPSFTGFLPLLHAAGLNPPIWVNELGVPIWDEATGQNAPGRATRDEQASYLVEAIADGLAAGIDKFFVFQLYDDGAGAVDPKTNTPAEFFGLISNNGTPRPAFGTYQNLVRRFSGARVATHLTFGRGPLNGKRKGVEVVTLYGVGNQRLTIAWNDDPGAPAAIDLPTSDPSATLLDKFGQTTGQATASNGALSLTLPGATNNNNFDCFTSQGCDPSDYIIGGSPVILVENDPRVPSALFDPLPFDSVAPVHLSWHATSPPPTGATYDVQYRDAADGVWHDWLVKTTATDALFGDGGNQLQGGHSYEFRIRVHDATGNLIGGQDYPARPLASTLIVGGNVQKPDAPLDAKVEIVWPQGNLPVARATKANVTAAIFTHGKTTSVNPSFAPAVTLWQAVNDGVGQPIATGAKRLVKAGNLGYPLWDFNDIDVSAARDPRTKEYFWITINGQPANSTVWAHGSDARTYFPQPDVPSGVLTTSPTAVDAKIEVVWPQGNLPVSQATKANVAVQVFGHGTAQSVPLNYNAPVRLYQAIDNGVLEPVAVGDRVVQTKNGVTFPTWQFNDVDVSAARDPSHRITFWVEVVGTTSYSNVWVHGVDARTNLPQPDVPTAVAPAATGS